MHHHYGKRCPSNPNVLYHFPLYCIGKFMHHHYGKRCPSHPNVLYHFPLYCIGKFIVLVLPERLILIFSVYWDNSTHFGRIPLKTSRTCTDILSYENDAIKVSKTAKNTNSTCITCTIVPGLMALVFFPNQSAMIAKVAV